MRVTSIPALSKPLASSQNKLELIYNMSSYSLKSFSKIATPINCDDKRISEYLPT